MESNMIKTDQIFVGVLATKELVSTKFKGADGTPMKISFENFFGEKIETDIIVEYVGSTPLRGMIFRVDNRNLSEDLLFSGNPSHLVFRYKIDGIEIVNHAPFGYDIKKPEKVGTLLRLLGYGEEISNKELRDFMKNIMNDEYFKHITELFGIEDGEIKQPMDNGLNIGLYQTLLLIRKVNQIDPSNREPQPNDFKIKVLFENDYLK